jgi:hypothetical protein
MNPPDKTAARVLVLVVFLLKLAWSASSLGSTDAVRFYKFGRQLAVQLLREGYAADPR